MATDSKKRTSSRPMASSTKGKHTNTRKGNSNHAPRKKEKSDAQESIQNKIYQDEITLIFSLVISILLILSNFDLSGQFGLVINHFTFGIFGFLAYLLPFILFIGVAFYLSNKGNKIATRKLVSVVILFLVLTALLQIITSKDINSNTIFEYYKISSESRSGGGIIGGTLCKMLIPAFGVLGTYAILIAIMIILIMFIREKAFFASLGKRGSKTYDSIREKNKLNREDRQYNTKDCDTSTTSMNKDKNFSLRTPKIFTFKKPTIEGEDSLNDNNQKNKKIKDKKTNNNLDTLSNASIKSDFNMEEIVSIDIDNIPINRAVAVPSSLETDNNEERIPFYEEEIKHKFSSKVSDYDIKDQNNQADTDLSKNEQASIMELGSDFNLGEAQMQSNTDEMEPIRNLNSNGSSNKTGKTSSNISSSSDEIIINMAKEVVKEYKFPPIDLLLKPKGDTKGIPDRELKETALKLQKTLESFGVRVTITNVSCGPAVTRYELQPEQGVKVSRITNLADDIKLNLAAADIRIEAPIPGKAAVGIEVPNKDNTAVMFRELIENPEFKKNSSNIAFAVGKDIGGQTVVTDIAKMPHLLIAGATGSGKSVCINTLIMSILYKANPVDVRLIMIDPKVVELSVYNGIPHLLIPVVTDPKKASAALNWAVMEMTERYNKFAEIGARDIKGYNDKIKKVEYLEDERFQKLPQIVIIVDELADLMMVAPGEVEDAICRLAQMARAAGLHLIIATQRPSVNVITGLIKANIPSRIAFSVSSAIDSRTIIDGSGAEKLLGRGDMLFFPSGYPKPVRIQGAFVSDKEVSSVVEFLTKQNNMPQYDQDITNKITSVQSLENSSNTANERDDYFIEAGKFIIDKDKASIGMLQRVYKIGFNRAARIMDQLSDVGVVGPEEGTKPRKVLMSLEEFEQYVDEYI